MGVFNWGKAVKEAGEGVESAFEGVGSGVANIIATHKGTLPAAAEADLLKLEVELNGELRKAKLEATVRTQEILADAQKATLDFMIQYEGTAKEVPKWVLIMRAVIRPVITIITMTSFFIFLGMDIHKAIRNGDKTMTALKSLPSEYWWVVVLVVGFWFGTKGLENIVKSKTGTTFSG